jgi:hypothetical protein
MKSLPPLAFTQTLTPEQLLTLYDLCESFKTYLWRHHRTTLEQQMIQQMQTDDRSAPEDNNLLIPFDDELPF